MNVQLWLMRHGETDWSVARRFCGWSDPPLNENGRAQALALRPRLAGHTFDTVVSSTSMRAVETARIAYGEPAVDERLRELDFGEAEGLTWDDCSEELRAEILAYETFAAPGGETVAALMARVGEAISGLGEGRHLVVTHGGVIRGLLGRAGRTEYPGPGTLHRADVTVTDGALQVSVPDDHARR